MIEYQGFIYIPKEMEEFAETIKLENYKTNTPKNFQKHQGEPGEFLDDLGMIIDIPSNRLDYVYFSACKGAEPHTDDLNLKQFHEHTYVIPIILPEGTSFLTEEKFTKIIARGNIYKFNHTKEHSLVLTDTESGCVLIMCAELREGYYDE